MTIKHIRNKDGTTSLIGSDGERCKVPAGILVSEIVGRDFTAKLARKVDEEIVELFRSGGITLDVLAARGVSELLKVHYGGGSRLVVRVVTGDSDPIAWAIFRRHSGHLTESQAAVHPSYRGLGIYTALLRLLKAEVSPVILSDKKLSVSNALQWMRHGTYDEAHGRIRLNPRRAQGRKPPRPDIQRAVLALYSRDATR